MPDKEVTLANLKENREAYAAHVEAIEADLALERQKRLGVWQAQIRNLVLRAYAEGASIAAIQRAYGTRDFNTIKRIIESGTAEVEQYKVEAVTAQTPTWFTVDAVDMTVEIGGCDFEIIEMDGAEFMLSCTFNDDDDANWRLWDGKTLLPESTGLDGELYAAILREVMP